ncbi:PEP-utilizing enzyme [Bosea sp. UC22_33]|uniref:PEP-utilizing enzyme n=1 Tax=Bosea sp. UC22_33 TaxID=3350165 RepID=UPI003671BFF3
MKPRVIILGAGRPFHGESHSSLRAVSRRGTVLDWLLSTLAPLGDDVHFVGGYAVTGIMERFPQLHYAVNPDWERSGSIRSLAEAGLGAGQDVYISYADILFRPDLVEALSRAASPERIGLAVDSSRRTARRTSREVVLFGPDGQPSAFGRAAEIDRAEYDVVGFVRIPASRIEAAANALASTLAKNPRAHLAAWLETLRERGESFSFHDASGHWTDLDDETVLARFIFGTKAETLARLAKVVTKARIAPQATFSVADWRRNRGAIAERVLAELPPGSLAVRSSARNEDGFNESNAGKFQSELNVGFDETSLAAAVARVIGSYDDGDDHQVLVQPMIRNVARSGVAFTRTLGVGAPYRVINSSEGSRTDIVTSGMRGESSVIYLHRGSPELPPDAHPSLTGLVEALDEVERLTELDTLDVEFAIDADDVCHILQVRPLVMEQERTGDTDALIAREIAYAQQAFDESQAPMPGVVGDATVFGIMPDWNPAELIGITPAPLAESLYRHLITDETWAVQRAEFGYRDLRHQPLIRLFAGHPYVDVRASLNSFIPAALPETVARRIVEAGIARLRREPHLHDKLEFGITLTCFDFAFDSWRERLLDAGLGQDEIDDYRAALIAITRHAFVRSESAWTGLAAYAAMQEHLLAADGALFSRLRASLHVCRRTGTLLFAHLARCGFVAMSLLKTAVETGLISATRISDFLGSIRTVGHRLPEDAWQVRKGTLAWDAFVARYGHLRPGTYDIGAPSYGEAPEEYLRPIVDNAQEPSHSSFAWSAEEARNWQKAMQAASLPQEIGEIDRFLRRSIEGREEAKFIFSRSVCAALNDIASWAEASGIARSDAAYLSISDILDIGSGSIGPDIERLQRRIITARDRVRLVQSMRLPPLLTEARDFQSFIMPEVEPNFVTMGKVTARVVPVASLVKDDALNGAIALIENADPGYDWLFGRKLAGFVTTYGGANSHMAIRAAEFGLPAAIGVGEVKMEALSKAEVVELDCAARRIMVLR